MPKDLTTRQKIEMLNKNIKQIKKSGLKPRSELITIQQEHSSAIIPMKLPEGGRIRYLNEANKYQEQFGLKQFTRLEYSKIVDKLIVELGDQLTLEGAKDLLVSGVQSRVNDLYNFKGEEPPILTFDNYKLYYDAIKEAGKKTKEKGKEASTQRYFFNEMQDYIDRESAKYKK